MLRKTLLTLCASALLGAAAMAPNTALAFLPPPPGGLGGPPPVPHLVGPPPHLGGPPPHLGGLPPRLGGPPPHARFGGPAGHPSGLSRFGGRAAGYGHGRSAGYGSSRSARSSYGDSYSRYRHRGRYDVYVDGADTSYSDDGCYYTYSRGRRVMVCDEN
jgi:hypothetical protein